MIQRKSEKKLPKEYINKLRKSDWDFECKVDEYAGPAGESCDPTQNWVYKEGYAKVTAIGNLVGCNCSNCELLDTL